jgi:hypothetical protein
VYVVYLNALEEKRLLELANDRTRLYHAAIKYSETLLPPATLYKLANVPARRAQLELRELVRRGWLKLVAEGDPKTRLVRYISTARIAIESDRCADGAQRSNSIASERTLSDRIRSPVSGAQRSDPIASSLMESDLPSGSRLRKTEPSVPTGEGAGRGEDGRTDGFEKFAQIARRLVASITRDWQLPEPVVEKCVRRFVDAAARLAPCATERELWRYFRAAFHDRESEHRHTHPAFVGINRDKFLGCVCALDESGEPWRFKAWREHECKREAVRAAQREREQRERERDDESLTPAQLHVLLEKRARSIAR